MRSRTTCPSSMRSAAPKTYNHYPNGWAMAFNTPFKMWKRYEFNGGTCDPCIISWPAGMSARGEIREQYHHAIDLVPTILDVLGVEPPQQIKGHVQSGFDGVSMRYSLDDATAPTARPTPVLLDARLPGDLARRLEGGHQPPHRRRLEPLQRRRVGAVPHRQRPRGTAQPRRRAPGQGPRAGEPLVRRSRRERGVPARRSLAARDHPDAATGPLTGPQPLRVLPGHGRSAGVPGGQRPQPFIRDRGAARPSRSGRRGRDLRPRVAVRRARALCRPEPTALRLQLRRHAPAVRGRERGASRSGTT